MKDLKTRVEETIKWKKSNKYCAKKLNISLDLFMIIKDQVIQELAMNPNKTAELANAIEELTAPAVGNG